MCFLYYMSINIKILSEIKELFSKITFCISSNYPTSDPLCGQTNGAIFIKKFLHGNFILYYNISKAQLDSSMGRHSNPCLLFADAVNLQISIFNPLCKANFINLTTESYYLCATFIMCPLISKSDQK